MKAISLNKPQITNEDFLSLVKESGFDGVDLGLHSFDLANDSFRDEMTKVRALFEKHGLSCPHVHLPFYGIFTSSELYEEKMETEITNSFEAMSILGAKWGAYHPMSSTNYEYDRKRALRDNRERLEKYLETASKFNVGIAVENLPIFPDCSQYKFFTYDEEDHIALVDSIDSPLIGICWDFGHANMMKYDMASVLDKIGNRIKITHIHNNNKMCDWHVCPGIGTLQWEEIMAVLKKHGYSGPINLELNLKLIHPEIIAEYLHMSGKMAKYLENLI